MKKILLILILPLFLLIILSGFFVARAQTTPTITGLTATGSAKQNVIVSWTAFSGAQSYQITRDKTVVGTSSTNSFTDNDTATTEGNHNYTINALDSAGKTIASGTFSINKLGATVVASTTTPPVTAPSSIAAPDVNDIHFSGRDSSIPDFISRLIEYLFGFVAALAVIAIVYSGVMMITAGADTTKAENAKKNLTWAIIGLVLAVSAYFLITLIINRLNTI